MLHFDFAQCEDASRLRSLGAMAEGEYWMPAVVRFYFRRRRVKVHKDANRS